MADIQLSKKHKAARLSDEKDVVEAWLYKLKTMASPKRVSDIYRFERTHDDVLRLAEVVDLETHEPVESDSSDLTTIAEKLIINEEAREVQNKRGLMVSQLNSI